MATKEEYKKFQAPKIPLKYGEREPNIEVDPDTKKFPMPDDVARLQDYEYYERLFVGSHFEAFNVRIDSDDYNRAYGKLRYVSANFAGLVSKIVADMLFTEPVTVKVPDGDQEYVDGIWRDNSMDIQCYESALSNSYLGDGLFKLRVGKRHPYDEKPSVIIEETTPTIYFPHINAFNVRERPQIEELAWTFKKGKDTYLRKEIHTVGKIENRVFRMKGDEIQEEVNLDILGITDLQEMVETKVNIPLLYHVPNWKSGNRYFGFSDYLDLDVLFYAINNRMTKVDNILDKHSDPILIVPPGILDEKGNVKKKTLGVMEVQEGVEGKPEYIVWDASLENAFKEIEKLVEFIYLVGEVSPDMLGLGKGYSDSGRALKFKLMRTIAKVARKRLYYDMALKNVIYAAQVLAKEHGVEVNDQKIKKDPVMPEIDWADGLPIDEKEQLENEEKAIDIGVTSKKAAIMRVYKVDEETADQIITEAEKERPKFTFPKPNPPFSGDDNEEE